MRRFFSPKPESHPVMKTTFFLTSTFLPDQGGILLTIQDNRATKIPARVFDSAAAAAGRLLFRSCCSISGSFHRRRRRRRRRQNRSLPRSSLPLLESVGWNFGKKIFFLQRDSSPSLAPCVVFRRQRRERRRWEDDGEPVWDSPNCGVPSSEILKKPLN